MNSGKYTNSSSITESNRKDLNREFRHLQKDWDSFKRANPTSKMSSGSHARSILKGRRLLEELNGEDDIGSVLLQERDDSVYSSEDGDNDNLLCNCDCSCPSSSLSEWERSEEEEVVERATRSNGGLSGWADQIAGHVTVGVLGFALGILCTASGVWRASDDFGFPPT